MVKEIRLKELTRLQVKVIDLAHNNQTFANWLCTNTIANTNDNDISILMINYLNSIGEQESSDLSVLSENTVIGIGKGIRNDSKPHSVCSNLNTTPAPSEAFGHHDCNMHNHYLSRLYE